MNHRAIQFGLVALAAAAATAVASGALGREPADSGAPSVERGRYLATVMVCNDCHTPLKMGPNGPEPDMTRMLSGHPQELQLPPPPSLAPDAPWNVAASATLTAWSGPWGVSYTANLTPDAETGLGHWTEEEFVGAIRTGRHMGRGRPILPPMPQPFFKNLNDFDLRSIFAYLRTIPAISNRVPEPLPPPAAQ